MTSMGVRGEEPQQNSNNNSNKNGTKIPRRLAKAKSCSNLPLSKIRRAVPAKGVPAAYATPLPAAREASICEQMASLSIGGRGSDALAPNDADQVNPEPKTPPPSNLLMPPPSLTTPQRAINPEDSPSAGLGVEEGPVVSKTPTIEQFEQRTRSFESAYKSVRKAKMAAAHSPLKQSPSFLSKYSNVTNFVAWDVDERLGTFESEFKAMKDIINHSIIGQKTLEEDVATFRLKGK